MNYEIVEGNFILWMEISAQRWGRRHRKPYSKAHLVPLLDDAAAVNSLITFLIIPFKK